tara:strand:+ start:108 stop:245 length:138 start_codon:yes stop_codon:yes gene_type:complete
MPGDKGYKRAEVQTPKTKPVAKTPMSTTNAANGKENVNPDGSPKL